MSNLKNPLRQYFRRPVIYLKLPSNSMYYDASVIEATETGELPVYPMTAIDEIATKTPDALFNGEAIAQLISSCIPNIKKPWLINSIDFDAILVAIKIASQGSTIELGSVCPSCNQEGKYDLNLSNVLAGLKPGEYNQYLRINELEVKFKPLTLKELNEASNGQFQAQKLLSSFVNSNPSNEEAQAELSKKGKEALEFLTNLTMDVLAKTIEHIKTPNTIVEEYEFILEFLKNCDKKDYEKIRNHNMSLKSSSDLKPLEIKCSNCGHEYSQNFTLNPSDFFG